MLTFAVVVAKPGREIPVEVRHTLDSKAPADLWFVPEDHVVWHDDRARTFFAGWQAGSERLGVGSRWVVRPESLTAFAGHLWHQAKPWDATRSWASQLAEAFARTPLEHLAPELDGVFSALTINRDGGGAISSDPLGVSVLYRAESNDVVVLSNRSALASRLITPAARQPARDVEGTGWLIYASNLQTDRTTHVGVTTVPQGSVTKLWPERAPTTESWSTRPWLDMAPIADDHGVKSALEAASTHIRSLVRLFAVVPSRVRTLELSGGHDSRLILALMLDEGLAQDFAYITWGSAELADVRVSREIANQFGLDLRAAGQPRTHAADAAGAGRIGSSGGPAVGAPHATVTDPSFEDQLRYHVSATSGAISIWDLVRTARKPSPNFALTGQFGELLRTNYAGTDGVGTVDDLRVYLRRGYFGFDAARLLKPEVRRHYDQLVLEQLEWALPDGGTPQDAVDGYNQMARLRRWFGTTHELDTRNRVFPLYSMVATQAAFAMGSEYRRAELLHFALMRSACDELARMPFAGSPWPAGVTALHSGDPSAYPTAGPVRPWADQVTSRPRRRASHWRARLRAASSRGRNSPRISGTAHEEGRMSQTEQKLPVLRSFLDLERNHPIFDLVDRRRVQHALGDIYQFNFHARRQVHDVVTAAIWLAGEERPDPGLRAVSQLA